MGLFLALAALLQVQGSADRIRALVDERLSSLDPELRANCSARLDAAVSSISDPARRQSILGDLPKLLQERAEVLLLPLRDAAALQVTLPSDLIREGAGIQTEYMVAEIARAGINTQGPEERARIAAQIDQIFATAGDLFRDHVRGADATPLLEAELGPTKKAWIASLERPMTSVLDRPLSAADLGRVLEEMRSEVKLRPIIALDAAGMADRNKLAEAGVLTFLADLKTRALRICYYGYPEFNDLQARENAWVEKTDARLDLLAESSAAPSTLSREVERQDKEPEVPTIRKTVRGSKAAAAPSHADGSPALFAAGGRTIQAVPEERSGLSPMWWFAFLGVFLLVLYAIGQRKFRASARR